MARRTAARSAAIVRAIPMRAPTPIIRVSAPRAPAKRKGHRRHASTSRAVNQKTIMSAAIGGAVMGFIDKSFPTLPTLPLLGRAGTIALVASMLAGRSGAGMGGIMRDVALAAAAVAGYELGKEGKVSGDVMGQLAPQVHGGIASQV